MKECQGLFGKWFGHNYVACYDKCSKIPDRLASVDYGTSIFIEALKTKTETYVHSVCTRCGDVIHREK